MTTVRAIGRPGIAAAVEPMVRAFWADPETVHLLPREAHRRRVLPRYLRSDAWDAAGFDMLLGAEVDGELAGAAACIPPEAYPVSIRRQLRQAIHLAPTIPWSWRTAAEARRGQLANRARHRSHVEPHFYLRAIGVDPRRQSTGAGTALMTALCARADARSAACFLQTAKAANVGWYARFGFRVVDEYRPTATWPTVWNLWRDAPTDGSPGR